MKESKEGKTVKVSLCNTSIMTKRTRLRAKSTNESTMITTTIDKDEGGDNNENMIITTKEGLNGDNYERERGRK